MASGTGINNTTPGMMADRGVADRAPMAPSPVQATPTPPSQIPPIGLDAAAQVSVALPAQAPAAHADSQGVTQRAHPRGRANSASRAAFMQQEPPSQQSGKAASAAGTSSDASMLLAELRKHDYNIQRRPWIGTFVSARTERLYQRDRFHKNFGAFIIVGMALLALRIMFFSIFIPRRYYTVGIIVIQSLQTANLLGLMAFTIAAKVYTPAVETQVSQLAIEEELMAGRQAALEEAFQAAAARQRRGAVLRMKPASRTDSLSADQHVAVPVARASGAHTHANLHASGPTGTAQEQHHAPQRVRSQQQALAIAASAPTAPGTGAPVTAQPVPVVPSTERRQPEQVSQRKRPVPEPIVTGLAVPHELPPVPAVTEIPVVTHASSTASSVSSLHRDVDAASSTCLSFGSISMTAPTKFLACSVASGCLGMYWSLTLIIETVVSITSDWVICNGPGAGQERVCFSLENGLFPASPVLGLLIVSIGAIALSVNRAWIFAVIISSFSIWVSMVIALFDPDAPGQDVEYHVARFTVSTAVLLLLLLSYAVIYSNGQRRAFALLVSMHRQLERYAMLVNNERAMREQLVEARESEIAANTARGVQEATLGYVAHQLRNPLHFLQSILRGLLKPEQNTQPPNELDIKSAVDASNRMRRIVDDVAAHQRLLTGRIELHPQWCEVRQVMQRVEQDVMQDSPSADHLRLKVDRIVPELVWMDPFRVAQIVAHGIANAFEHGHAGTDVSLAASIKLARPVNANGEVNDAVVTDAAWWYQCDEVTRATVAEASPLSMSEDDTIAAERDRRPSEPNITLDRLLRVMPPGLVPFLHLEVVNVGHGLHGLDANLLFAPFDMHTPSHEPARAVTTQRIRSTGLGLPISRMLALLMGARIGLVDTAAEAAALVAQSAILPPASTQPERRRPVKTRFFLQVPLRYMRRDELSSLAVGEMSHAPGHTPGQVRAAAADAAQLTRWRGGGTLSGSPQGAIARLPTAFTFTDLTGTSLPVSTSPDHAALSARMVDVGSRSTDDMPSRDSSGGSSVGLTADRGSLRPPRVLAVDDDAVVLRLHARWLTQLGCIVYTATDGDEAVELVAKTSPPFDAVIMDIIMKRMNGDEACRRMREAGVASPIIAATGNPSTDDALAWRAAGFTSVLLKPFTKEHLKQCLEACRILPPTNSRSSTAAASGPGPGREASAVTV